MATDERLALSRFFARFMVGAAPGEFENAINNGYSTVIANHLNNLATDGGTMVPPPALTDLGPFPLPKDPKRVSFGQAMQDQRRMLIFWWLDRMVLSQTPMLERATWFWHGHWATSVGKVEYALPMYLQNVTLRNTAFGDFGDQVTRMIADPALLYWLDAGANLKQSPNENLARELMELFTLGVDNYTQNDVTQVARALTGWSVNRHSATTNFQPKQHDNSQLSILGSSGSFDAPAIAKLMVAQNACAQFIPMRLWFRFISSTSPIDPAVVNAFHDRQIAPVFNAMLNSAAMSDPANSMVRSPVEWFVATCKALQITPSQLANPGQVMNFLTSLGQLPFDPPNVGGWPHDSAWLSAAASQYRLSFANYLISHGQLPQMHQATSLSNQIGSWLGVYQFSTATSNAINSAKNLSDAALLALVSPEFVVNV